MIFFGIKDNKLKFSWSCLKFVEVRVDDASFVVDRGWMKIRFFVEVETAEVEVEVDENFLVRQVELLKWWYSPVDIDSLLFEIRQVEFLPSWIWFDRI